MYATYYKKTNYQNDGSRSISGINLELIGHYFFYAFGNSHCIDGAYIQPFSSSPQGVIDDFDAFLFEACGFLVNPILYFFR